MQKASGTFIISNVESVSEEYNSLYTELSIIPKTTIQINAIRVLLQNSHFGFMGLPHFVG